ncbi:MAG: FG-GAP-like repeat-containing protein [Planctomycetota bacterium]
MDLDSDGNNEVISGSYWPGHIFIFRSNEKGEFAKGVELTDATGEKLHGGKKWKSENEPDMDSLAAAPWMVDFDADGDLDLLIGNIAGRIILIPNEGTAKEPKFSADRIPLKGGDDFIKVPGGDAGPHVADWDGDGKWDLLSGAGDGSVWFFKNVGEKGKPKFAQGVTLIAAGKRGYKPLEVREEPTEQGGRSKICVVDYDKDGHLDLLVGDFASVKKPDPVLSDEQKKRRDELLKQQKDFDKEYMDFYQKVKDLPQAEMQKKLEPYAKKMRALYEELQPLQGGQATAGWVWFFKRKAPASTMQLK